MIIALTGFMGCGKSSTARALSRLTGLPLVDLDHQIEQVSGRGIPEIFAAEGESGFRTVELAVLRQVLDEAGEESLILALGGGTFTVPEARELILSRTRCVYLHASLDKIRRNIGSGAGCTGTPACADTAGTGAEASSKDTDVSAGRPLFRNPEQVEALYAARLPLYRQAPVHICMDDLTPKQAAERIRRLIL